jgi:hypothetical protein
MANPLEALLDFLDARVFTPTASADPLRYADVGDRKLLKSVQRRVHETRVRYFGTYATAVEVKANFAQDLNSKPGQALANDMYLLKLSRFEDIREEFSALCKKNGL